MSTIHLSVRPEKFKFFKKDGYVYTECRRHNSGWLCKLDGLMKFPDRKPYQKKNPPTEEINL